MLPVGALAAPTIGAGALTQTPLRRSRKSFLISPAARKEEYSEVDGASSGFTFNTVSANGTTYWVVALEHEGAGVLGDEGTVNLAVPLTGSASGSCAWASTANETYSGTPNATCTEDSPAIPRQGAGLG